MTDYIDREEERVVAEYIERKRIEKFFDGIYDCADLTFEPNDHCCAADDCAHCKWRETMDAIKKRILSIPAADVRPVKRGKWVAEKEDLEWGCYLVRYHCYCCGRLPHYDKESGKFLLSDFCPKCGADMREEN